MKVELKEVDVRLAKDQPFPKNGYKDRYSVNQWNRDQVAKPRIYISVEGENILENLAYRTVRPSKLYRTFIPEILERANLPRDLKVSWSQYAGCSCPCSPGFIINDARAPKGMTIYATLVGGQEAKIEQTAEAYELANKRAGGAAAQLTFGTQRGAKWLGKVAEQVAEETTEASYLDFYPSEKQS